MHGFALLDRAGRLPSPADPEAAGRGWERFAERAGESDAETRAFAEALAADAAGRALGDAIFGNSPFLTECMLAEPGFVRILLECGADDALDSVLRDLAAAEAPEAGEDLAKALRVARRRVALTVAAADIADIWTLEEVTGALSDFADRAVAAATRRAIADAAAKGAFRLVDPDNPAKGAGFFVLALGKLGARELNYSSDIDLICLFDPEVVDTDDPDGLQKHMIRIARQVVSLLDERTRDGYVFRTDMRLRPDPSSTPLALSTIAAEVYYESLGQNWERAAMIKARPVGGDIEAGRAFLKTLVPFVWRKNLDFAAIQDIHSIKRQIHAHKGGGEVRAEGHNIKIGRGGIREVEFFVQTEQLIWGGKVPPLRRPRTLDALKELVALEQVADDEAADLDAGYRFLRRVEHRLQMIADQQTQVVPEGEKEFRQLALFLGYDDAESFREALIGHLSRVRDRYAGLFEEAPSLGAVGDDGAGGNLVFTGTDADPETLETLERMGFEDAKRVDAAVRGWHRGHVRATRSTRAREILTELMPVVLKSLAGQPEPDGAFLRFDKFLSQMPSGVQLFSLFQARPELLDLVAEIMGEAPAIAEHLARHPALLESVLSNDFFEGFPTRDELIEELTEHLARVDYMEGKLDAVRRWNHDRRFQVGVQILRGMIEPRAAARALSDLADATLEGLYPAVRDDYRSLHGDIPGAEAAVIALGKLGSQELTPASDLDLIFIYRLPEGAEGSDGDKPQPPTQYFARMFQRYITGLTALTSEGRLYEVDMRLRPTGRSGPIATPLDGFEQYHAEKSWTFEHMAMTRARIVFGDAALVADLERAVERVLTRPRDPDQLLHDVADMRRRMAKEHGTRNLWALKQVRGGLVDVDFIAQYMMLRHASEFPDVLHRSAREAFQALATEGLLAPEHEADLIAAYDLWQALQTFLALTVAEDVKSGREREFSDALKDDLVRIGGADDFDALEKKIAATAKRTHAIYRDLVDEPAKALANTAKQAEAD